MRQQLHAFHGVRRGKHRVALRCLDDLFGRRIVASSDVFASLLSLSPRILNGKECRPISGAHASRRPGLAPCSCLLFRRILPCSCLSSVLQPHHSTISISSRWLDDRHNAGNRMGELVFPRVIRVMKVV